MLSRDPMVQEFILRWESMGGLSYLAEGRSELIMSCQTVCRQVFERKDFRGGSPTVVYGNDPEVSKLDWPTMKFDGVDVNWALWGGTMNMRQATADSVLAITGCAWAVASTGSVALYSTSETGLLPSVLAPYHLVLIRRDKLVSSVAEGLGRLMGSDVPPLVKIITGPSMTADIEGILVTGVHGPGRVMAIIYETSATSA